jgi:uncharacterized protein
MMEQKISQDLRTAMLAKDAQKVSVLRSLKSAFTYVKVAPGYVASTSDGLNENNELSDEAVMSILAKEAKKRQESADSFHQAGQEDRAQAEAEEKAIIEAYLPAQLSEDAVRELVTKAIAELDDVSPKAMGQVIAAVKQQAGPTADGALIARLVKEGLSQQNGQGNAS